MNNTAIQTIVDKALFLDREIASLTRQLTEIKGQLVVEARSHSNEFTLTPGGGKSWTTQGSDGAIARVTFPGKSLRAKIEAEGKAIEKIRAAAGKMFQRLFTPVLSYQPIAGFRDEAVSLLGEDDGKTLTRLCETASKPRVSFEVVERKEDKP